MPDQQNVSQVSQLATTELADDVIEKYFEMGWTDGLPVVPPTREKIDLFVAANALLRLDQQPDTAHYRHCICRALFVSLQPEP